MSQIQRFKIGYSSDDWGHRSSTPSGIPYEDGQWVRFVDHVAAVAAIAQQGEPAQQPLTDEQIDECERLAGISYRRHITSCRGQIITPADGFRWHFVRAVEAAITGDTP